MRARLAIVVILLAAKAPPGGDRFYQAIRQDDLEALRALVRDEGVNATDPQGQTPLMLGGGVRATTVRGTSSAGR